MILRPPIDADGKRGVYPKTDRNSLLIKGGPNAGEPQPNDGDSFYLGFPEPIGGHTLRLNLAFKIGQEASGHEQANRVPVEWQGWCGTDGWQPAVVEQDSTKR